MKVIVFDTHQYDKEQFCKANSNFNHDLNFYEGKLNDKSVMVAKGYPCVCVFVNDIVNENILNTLALNGTKLMALRSSGYNNVDLNAAKKVGIKVVRVPEYSPFAVAEHAMSLLLTLNRKIHKSYNRVREGNFSLDGLLGFDLNGKTIGIIGTGRIGKVFAKIAHGLGCKILAYDLFPDKKLSDAYDCTYTTLQDLYSASDVISLHLPLSATSHHMIDDKAIALMKDNVLLINTSRGAIIDTKALIRALKKGKIGGAGLDVYEEEEEFFFQDLSGHILNDDILARLLTFPNVILTGHQGFFTQEALSSIANTTLHNIQQFELGQNLTNEVIK